MRKVQLIIYLSCITFILSSTARAQEWHGIKVLRSTRSDVEKLIGNPMEPNGNIYDLKDERVTVFYSGGSCAKGWPFGWNVPEGIVIGITVYLKKTPMLGDLGVDLSEYKKFNDPHDGGVTYYSNAEKGISIMTNSDGKVVDIQYSHSRKDSHLLCPEAAAREAEVNRGESSDQEPLLYYLVNSTPPEDEKKLLDYFAGELLKHPAGSKVYIIAYAGRRARVNEAQMLMDRVKGYLVNKLGVEPQGIVAIDGGYQEEGRVDLYIVEPGSPKPLASPTVHPGFVQHIKGPYVISGSGHYISLPRTNIAVIPHDLTVQSFQQDLC
jgi:hypothetical protein